MRNGDASVVSSLFGAPGQVEVERGLAEFRGGGPAARRRAAVMTFAAPALPRLVITSRRARALGLDGSEPVAIALDGSEDIEKIEALIAAVGGPRPPGAKGAHAP